MAQGLKPHYHQYFEYNTKVSTDNERGCIVRKVTYMCMICGKLKHEIYESYLPPPKSKGNKALEKHKRKFGNH